MDQITKSKYDNIIYKVKNQSKEKVSILAFLFDGKMYDKKSK